MRTFQRVAVAASITGIVAMQSACSTSGELDMKNPESPSFAELMKLPTIDEAAKRYTMMITRIHREISFALPELSNWHPGDAASESGCETENTDVQLAGEERGLPIYVTPGNVPDDQWKRVVEIVEKIVVDYGFDKRPLVLHDSPGSHDVAFHNLSDGSRLSMGTAKATTIYVHIGCHLTAEAKRRGRPSS